MPSGAKILEQMVVVAGVQHRLPGSRVERQVVEQPGTQVVCRVPPWRAGGWLEARLHLSLDVLKHASVEVPRVPAGVRQQVVDENLLGARARHLGHIVHGRTVESQQPVFDELHGERGRDGFARRRDGKDRFAVERRRSRFGAEHTPGVVQDDHAAACHADAQRGGVACADPASAQLANVLDAVGPHTGLFG
jgi:hypothetical protein